MTSFRTTLTAVLGAVALSIGACGGNADNKTDEAATADSATMAASAEAWKSRRAIADSIVQHAPPMKEVVNQLGSSRYDEADASLVAAVMKESEKTRDCYANAVRDLDPNLTVVLYVLVNFGAAGWDLMRVEKWQPPTGAVGAVISCINYRAKSEWKLPIKGVKPGAHLVKFVYTPDSAVAWGKGK